MNESHLLLLTPGPTVLPPEVKEAFVDAGLHHREPRFRARLAYCLGALRRMIHADGDVLVLTASGRGGLEAAIVNAFSPGDTVLACTNGHFGLMFARIARDYGLDVIEIAPDWSRPVPVEEVITALRKWPAAKGILIVHSETSTGVLNDVESLAQAIDGEGRLLLVDAMSSLGTVPLDMRWGLDAVISCSQKGLMSPPGIAIVATSSRYNEKSARSTLPKSYWDFSRHAPLLAKSPPETHNTASVPIILALAKALERIERIGVNQVYRRTALLADKIRQALALMGLSVYTAGLESRYGSPSVTTVLCPDGVEVSALLRYLREHSQIMMGRGLGKLAERTFRIGHMGAVDEWMVVRGLDGIRQALSALGHSPGDGTWAELFTQEEVSARHER